MLLMKYFILLLAFLIPSISFASAVPTWVKGSGISNYFDVYNTASSTNPILYLTPPSFVGANIGSFIDGIFYQNAPSSSAEVPNVIAPSDLESGGSSTPNRIWLHVSSTDPTSLPNYYDWYSTRYFEGVSGAQLLLLQFGNNFCNSGISSCPSTVYVGYSQAPNSATSTTQYTPIFYVELNLQSGSFGNNPVYTVNAQPGNNIYPAYTGPGSTFAISQSLKNAVAQNTVQPDCDFTELFQSGFWSECVARSIFNWLFIPSDNAIDQLVEVSTNPDFGRSWPYVVLAPIFMSTLVQACPLENPSTCDVGGGPLTIPILDQYGSSTPFTIDVPTLVPAYIDAFFASMLQAFIIIGISYVLLTRFL